jgi:hypothetical protein
LGHQREHLWLVQQRVFLCQCMRTDSSIKALECREGESRGRDHLGEKVHESNEEIYDALSHEKETFPEHIIRPIAFQKFGYTHLSPLRRKSRARQKMTPNAGGMRRVPVKVWLRLTQRRTGARDKHVVALIGMYDDDMLILQVG